MRYAYDHVFDGRADNTLVYKTIGSRIVRTAMDGINGTIFAYGVTSSGKTHTMMVGAARRGRAGRGRGGGGRGGRTSILLKRDGRGGAGRVWRRP